MRIRPQLLGPALLLFTFLALQTALVTPVRSAEAEKSATASEKAQTYKLRYKFKSGEEIRSRVLHQATVRTTIEGTSQTAATVSESIKVWRIKNVDAEGRTTFVHSVDHVNMRNQVTGREDVHFDSQKDKKPPAGFEDVAKRVGVPLTVVTMDNRGTIVKREDRIEAGQVQPTQLTLPLPDHGVAIGESWLFPSDVRVSLRGGETKLIHARQRITLDAVVDGIAIVKVETQILTPVHDPEIESQLIERESSGTIHFDIEAGRVISQQIDLDRSLVGYPNEKSSMHYRTRFTEEVLAPGERTAEVPREVTPKK